MKNEKSVTLQLIIMLNWLQILVHQRYSRLIDNGGEGVGLFRTEFLYGICSITTTEEEQFNVYRREKLVLEGLEGSRN